MSGKNLRFIPEIKKCGYKFKFIIWDEVKKNGKYFSGLVVFMPLAFLADAVWLTPS